MARCFFTGVEFPLHDAFVLNRRHAHDLLAVLRERAASLQRVIEQLSPLDAYERTPRADGRDVAFAPKKHRLVCKAVADALAPGYPEIKLFLSWIEYRSEAQRTLSQASAPTASTFTSGETADAVDAKVT